MNLKKKNDDILVQNSKDIRRYCYEDKLYEDKSIYGIVYIDIHYI